MRTIDVTEREKYTDSRFFSGINEKKEVDSAFWFQKSLLWLQVSFGYNNPLNIGKVHSELFFLNDIMEDLLSKVNHNNIVFLGVGNGDTEMLFLDGVVDKFKIISTITGVDINRKFLDLFENSIKMRDVEYDKYEYEIKKIVKNFEQLTVKDFPCYLRKENKVICVLGNTVGNYNNIEDIVGVLDGITISGDQVLLSYQLNTYMRMIYEKCRDNIYFNEFITHYLYMERDDYKYIEWVINEKNSAIEAWLDDIQLFRSKKFNKTEMNELMKKSSFETIDVYYDKKENLAIHLFDKR